MRFGSLEMSTKRCNFWWFVWRNADQSFEFLYIIASAAFVFFSSMVLFKSNKLVMHTHRKCIERHCSWNDADKCFILFCRFENILIVILRTKTRSKLLLYVLQNICIEKERNRREFHAKMTHTLLWNKIYADRARLIYFRKNQWWITNEFLIFLFFSRSELGKKHDSQKSPFDPKHEGEKQKYRKWTLGDS